MSVSRHSVNIPLKVKLDWDRGPKLALLEPSLRSVSIATLQNPLPETDKIVTDASV